jgi:peptidoglycan glycosyltransferase
MVSLPSYNPNKLASHDFQAANAYATQLSRDKAQPLLNRAVQTTLPPGSTFKIVTASAAIENGVYSSSSQVPGGSSYTLPQSSNVVHNDVIGACGTTKIPFTQAMQFSCNTSFAPMAVKVGATDMHAQAEGYGFNQHYLDTDQLPFQAISRYPAGLDPAQTALAGFGQGSVTATPLQMAMTAAGIANNGVVMKPHLVQEVESPSQQPLAPTQIESFSHATSRTTSDEVTKLMVATVQGGTARPAAIPGVVVAGKTGTAQSGLKNPDGTEVPPYAWFVSFAPANPDPQVAVCVMIQHVDKATDEIHGGTLGGPIAKAVMEAVLRTSD